MGPFWAGMGGLLVLPFARAGVWRGVGHARGQRGGARPCEAPGGVAQKGTGPAQGHFGDGTLSPCAPLAFF